MFKKILLPVDVSDRHGQALDAAADLAGPGGGEITLLHVIEVIAGLTMEEEKDFYRRLEKTARAKLAQLGDRLKPRNVAWRAEVLYGNRGAEVVRHARETGTDLIVLTAPRFDPQHPDASWGSLSYAVGMLAPCPVLLVK
jgi:nucleotide-binding universal stress UspA family protein